MEYHQLKAKAELASRMFEKGAASRRAEIDELKTINTNLHQGQQILDERINELQKRINLALSAVWNDELSHIIIDILRGESDE